MRGIFQRFLNTIEPLKDYITQIKKLTLRAFKTDTKCVYLTIG